MLKCSEPQSVMFDECQILENAHTIHYFMKSTITKFQNNRFSQIDSVSIGAKNSNGALQMRPHVNLSMRFRIKWSTKIAHPSPTPKEGPPN